jgi:hypothetical protein
MNRAQVGTSRSRQHAGLVSMIFGALALAAVVWVALLTYVINPPNWIRIAGSSFLPIGIVIGLGTGVLGRRGPERRWAITGLTLVAIAVITFTALNFSVDY